ncbi:hypothetical protein Poli38472_006262 [Pythium oligandrum]|uniref:DUF3752 domain-containing protein n=1 Tax=Pythium oligandrum TaxID=41045 RepID=A0A8K1CT69_PYTOL|nr:hypothetical protein Poli38472_006262 [Pythium oligandrum]|eukprot:TMW68794.1 hypothetical protein Poli38472_006262 [Pythium oligandrum]
MARSSTEARRHRRDESDSEDGASSSSSSVDAKRSRKRSRHDEDKRHRHKDERKYKKRKKHKKSEDKKRKKDKKRKERRRDDSSASDKSSGDEREAPLPDYERAMVVVKTLLSEFPAIASELLSLLQMLDDGETAVLSGIADERIKSLLTALFPLLGITKLRRPRDAFSARGRRDTSASLLETVAKMLSGGQDDKSTESKPAEPLRRAAPIGPALPPAGGQVSLAHEEEEEDDDMDVVGPALPGQRGFRVADERVEAEMARKAKQLEEDEWRRTRGEKVPVASTGLSRQDWMTQMPEDNKLFQDAMGPTMKRNTGRPAAFRAKEPAAVDRTWFDSPEERDRAQRAKLDMELLGYVRAENAPARSADSMPVAGDNGGGVNESILPAANPEADREMRQQMEALRERRGPSLLEQHQQKQAEEAKRRANDGTAAVKPKWDRERDLTVRKTMSQQDADRIIEASKQVSSKFTAPTVTRQFL